MDNTILQLGNAIGLVLQSIYFAYFMVSVKNLRNKKIEYILFVMIEFWFLKYICKLNYTINFELMLGILMCIILKLFYQIKFRITDFIIYIISLVFLGIISVSILIMIGANIYSVILGNLLAICLTYLLRHKLIKIDDFFNKFWNRHNIKKALKSVTIRGFSSVLTIITFLLIHLWLIYGILIVRR